MIHEFNNTQHIYFYNKMLQIQLKLLHKIQLLKKFKGIFIHIIHTNNILLYEITERSFVKKKYELIENK